MAQFIARLLYSLGHPLYVILEKSTILSLLIFYQIGQIFIRLLPGLLAKALTSFTHIKGPKYRFPKLTLLKPRLPKLKLSFPSLPQIPRITLAISAFCFLLSAFFASSFWFFILRDLPQPNDLIQKPRPLTTRIYDRNGELLFKIFRSQNRTYIPLGEIPLAVQQATIAIEDAEFYYHPGFSIRGILRAIERNVIRGQLAGGSTITQQLVKNALLTPERTLQRKLKEVILAFWTETTFSKDKILEMYLNEVSYGGTAYGIEEAARTYFGKNARELTLAEASLLAGLPAAPTRSSPFGINPDLARVRQQLVLARMAEEGFITSDIAQQATQEQISFAPQRVQIKAPHFVMWVKQLLVEEYGERLVEEGGLEVITSLDLKVQEKAEQIVSEEVENLARLRVGNGAALVTNPTTGEVLAMVGSKNYFESKSGSFNVTLASRQPGSAIKPVNYAYALSHNFTPVSIIEDSPISYVIPGQPPYSPRNYDNKFRGNIPLRIALGSSLNVPAVKVLSSYGVEEMIKQGQAMGITTWNEPSRFGLSLTLGGGEVKMVDLSVVYGTLANYGEKVPLDPILKVKDNRGKVIGETNCKTGDRGECGNQVIDARVAFLLTDILRDNNARIPTFGPNSLLVIPGHPEVAVKTGTTQNLRDNWAIGYTKDYVVTTWVGNNDNAPMSYVASGVTGATPIWHNIMRYLLDRKTDIADQSTPITSGTEVRASENYWNPPDEVVRLKICSLTGTLPCEGCPIREEWFLKENAPTKHCILPTPTPTP